MDCQELAQFPRPSRNGSLRHIVENILFITGLFWRDPVWSVFIKKVLSGWTGNEILFANEVDLNQRSEQADGKRHAWIMRDRSFDYAVTLPINPDPIFHDLDGGVEAFPVDLDVTPDCPERLDRGFDRVFGEAMHVDDRAEVQVVVPRDQCVIPHRTQASTLPQEENHTVFVEDLLRFP